MAIDPGLDWAIAVRSSVSLFLDPVQFFHEAFPHQRDNDEAAAEGAGAQLKGREKQLPAFIFLVQ